MTDDGNQPPLAPAPGVWPAGHRAALCLTVNIAGSDAADALSFAAPLEPAYERTGAGRLLRLLADTGVEATFTWSRAAVMAEAGLVEQARAGGHELATWLGEQDRPEGRIAADLRGVRVELERIVEAEVVGVDVAGRRDHEAVFRVAQEIGMRWVVAPPAGDLPVILQPDGALPALVHLPASRWFDDRDLFGNRGLVARHAFEAWRDALDTIRDEGGLIVLRLHPSVSGRPGPSRAIAQLLDYAIDAGDLWLTRADHLALWWAERQRTG